MWPPLVSILIVTDLYFKKSFSSMPLKSHDSYTVGHEWSRVWPSSDHAVFPIFWAIHFWLLILSHVIVDFVEWILIWSCWHNEYFVFLICNDYSFRVISWRKTRTVFTNKVWIIIATFSFLWKLTHDWPLPKTSVRLIYRSWTCQF